MGWYIGGAIVIVIIVENCPPPLRGELSRWLIQPKPGIFVGKVSALVREQLWRMCISKVRDGSVIQIWNANNEQGFSVRSHGTENRIIEDYEGLALVKELTKETLN